MIVKDKNIIFKWTLNTVARADELCCDENVSHFHTVTVVGLVIKHHLFFDNNVHLWS